MDSLTSKEFWAATATRAVRTFAQGMLGTLGTNVAGVTQVDWVGAAAVGVSAAIVSVLMAVAWPNGVPEGAVQ